MKSFRVIDTHVHMLPASFSACPAGLTAAEWPEIHLLPDGRARLLLGGKEFRIFQREAFDPAARVAQMDHDGVTVQVVSPLPELLSYWLPLKAMIAIAERVHGAIAEAVARFPGRIAGIGMLPLADVELSVRTAREMKALGFCGVLVASNVNGVSLADNRFSPVFAELEALGLAVFVHGYRPAGGERLLGSPMLTPAVGVPQDTMAVIASFIATDILGRFPRLKLGFGHGGGAIAAVIDRLDHVQTGFGIFKNATQTRPRDYIRRFYYDSVVYGQDYLRYLISVFGPDRIMAGTDGPPPLGQGDVVTFVRSACGDTETAEKILWRNATRFFGLERSLISLDHSRTS